MHQWMLDSGYTPHIVVDARREGVRVPEAHVKDGRIVLNVSLTATRGLELGNDAVTFEARFGGVPQRIYVPVGAVLGIYARETGQGMVFGEDDSPPPSPPPPPQPDDTGPSPAGTDRRAKLKVVK
jgi:stringent starvation protein B